MQAYSVHVGLRGFVPLYMHFHAYTAHLFLFIMCIIAFSQRLSLVYYVQNGRTINAVVFTNRPTTGRAGIRRPAGWRTWSSWWRSKSLPLLRTSRRDTSMTWSMYLFQYIWCDWCFVRALELHMDSMWSHAHPRVKSGVHLLMSI